MNRKDQVISNLTWRFLERCGAQMVSFIVSIVILFVLLVFLSVPCVCGRLQDVSFVDILSDANILKRVLNVCIHITEKATMITDAAFLPCNCGLFRKHKRCGRNHIVRTFSIIFVCMLLRGSG